MISAALLSAGIGSLLEPNPGAGVAFSIVWGSAGLGFLFGIIADRLLPTPQESE